MNRITIVSVFSLLTALASAASVGCIGQTTTTTTRATDGTTEQEPKATYSDPASTDDQVAEAKGQPVRTLELGFAPPGTEQQGPFPEPWIRVMGPFPEPWHGKAAESSGNGSTGNDPNNPKP